MNSAGNGDDHDTLSIEQAQEAISLRQDSQTKQSQDLDEDEYNKMVEQSAL